MARALRVEYPGAVHHITSRGNERRNIFRSDADRRMFLEFLAAATRRFGWLVTAWVLMSNHFHLVIETPMENLSQGIRLRLTKTRRVAYAEQKTEAASPGSALFIPREDAGSRSSRPPSRATW